MRISDWSSDVCSSDLAVSKRVIAYVSQSDFGLVETLAERVAAIVIAEFGVQRVRVKLSKPGAVRGEIGRASCRERVCQYVSISVVGVSLYNKYLLYYSVYHIQNHSSICFSCFI